MKIKDQEKYLDTMETIIARLDTFKEHATLEEQREEFPKLILMLDELKDDYIDEISKTFTNKIRRFFGLPMKIPEGKFNASMIGLMMILIEENKRVGILDDM